MTCLMADAVFRWTTSHLQSNKTEFDETHCNQRSLRRIVYIRENVHQVGSIICIIQVRFFYYTTDNFYTHINVSATIGGLLQELNCHCSLHGVASRLSDS